MDGNKPTTYVPFSRWFTNERQRELDEVRGLYEWVKAAQNAFTETRITVSMRVAEYFDDLSYDIQHPFLLALHDLVSAESYIWELPAPTFERMSLKEFVEYRNLLHAKQYFFVNQEAVLQQLHEGLVRLLYGTARDLPETGTPSPFTIPLIYTLDEPRLAVERIFGTIANGPYEDVGLFKDVSAQLHRNLCHASGKETPESKKPYKLPSESTLPLDALVDTYLAHTPFLSLFKTPVPLKLTHEDRFNHMHIVGGTGSGKTSLIETLLAYDITSEDPPSLVVLDPHSDLVRKLARADVPAILIDPRDTRHPPALNVFALNQKRLGSYDEATREQIVAGAIQTFEFLFAGFGIDLTGKQQVLFRNACRLMLALPETMGRNATILDMMHLMKDPTPYLPAIERLPDIPREFFARDFNETRTFGATRDQIRYRLQAIVENPTMARLFTSEETKVDLFEELNRGTLILVDTAKDFLKDSSAHYGRLFLSLVFQAVLERAALSKRKDTFIIVDEAASFFSDDVSEMLAEVRKYRTGLVLAHQFRSQATSSLLASLDANTGIKFASGLSAGDARAMAPDMRTTADFILAQPALQFAAHIRNVTPHAVSIPISWGALDELPRRTDAEYEAFLAANRLRVSASPSRPPAERTAPPTDLSPRPDEDISPEW